MDEINQYSDFLFYNSEDGSTTVQVIVGTDTVWATQRGMSQIFQVTVPTINEHIQNIFKAEELSEDAVVRKIRITASDGKEYLTNLYNLDAIISVGYRVNSYNATKFRIWATKVLKEYLIKGFALDDERLKQGNNLFNKDYFRELLERIREIRSSEKMFYEQVRDIFATSVDYDKKSPEAVTFFSTIQNKLEYAIVGKTSAEIIKTRANALMPHMNLTTWKNFKKGGDIQKLDVTVAKNYLKEKELSTLKLLVTMFLDYAELQAERNKLMKMADWVERVDSFLKFNDYAVLVNSGSLRKDVADKFAEGEYEKYKVLAAHTNARGFIEATKDIRNTGHLPTERKSEKEDLSSFDKQLKGLLRTPPPKNGK